MEVKKLEKLVPTMAYEENRGQIFINGMLMWNQGVNVDVGTETHQLVNPSKIFQIDEHEKLVHIVEISMTIWQVEVDLHQPIR